MNDLAKENLNAVLPERIAEGLRRALAQLPEGKTAKIEKPISEGASNHTLLITTAKERYVFRARRDSFSEKMDEYTYSLYKDTGFLEMGGMVKFRTIAEEIEFMKNALNVGLPLPKLIHTDTDWMVIEYVEGRRFSDFLNAGKVEILLNILKEINLAHKHGIIYGDRWGNNEIIDAQGKMWMIDFDYDWSYQGDRDGIVEALEMAVTIFNSLRITSARNDLLKLVRVDVLPLLKSWNYHIEVIGKFIKGLGKFYVNPNKPTGPWALPPSLHVTLPEPTNRLVAMFTQNI